VNRCLVVQRDVAYEELAETVYEQGVDGRIVAVAGTEWRETRQETVWEGFAIGALYNFRCSESGLEEELLTKFVGQLMLEHITHKAFADICPTTLVAKDKSKWRYVLLYFTAIIVARVGSGTEYGDDAGFVSAESASCSEHITLDLDEGIATKGRIDSGYNLGGCFEGTACTIEVYFEMGRSKYVSGKQLGKEFETDYLVDFFFGLLVWVYSLGGTEVLGAVIHNETPRGLGRPAVGYQFHSDISI